MANSDNYVGCLHALPSTSNDVEDTPLLTIKNEPKPLLLVQKIAYGFGHVFNDLCAAMWFSYLLFYLQIVLQMKSTTAGMLLMLGQVVDALATPVAGRLIDKYGTRQLWHFIGTILVTISFPLVFTACSLCSQNDNIQYLFYHIFVIAVFQIGWAIVQISHLSIIPSLTNIPAQRSDLTTIRYTAAVCSNIVAYVITWIVLQSNSNETIIDSSDYHKFHTIVIIILIAGIASSLTFYCGIKWSYYNMSRWHSHNSLSNESIRNLFTSSLLYQISLLNFSDLCSNIFVNI